MHMHFHVLIFYRFISPTTSYNPLLLHRAKLLARLYESHHLHISYSLVKHLYGG